MQGFGWQFAKKVTIPAGQSLAVLLPYSRPVLEQLTVWASTGVRIAGNVTFQLRVNTKAFGSNVSVVGAVVADIVAGEGETYTGSVVFPVGRGHLLNPDIAENAGNLDPLDVDVLITNADAAALTLTLYVAGIGRDG